MDDTAISPAMIQEETSPQSKGTSRSSEIDNSIGRFATLIGVLGESFRQKVTETTIEAYRIGLYDLPVDAIEKSIHAAIRSCKFMPTVAELRELAGGVKAEDRAVHAFAALEEAISGVGVYHSPSFDDPLINATVRNLGGWERICTMPGEQFDTWLRKDFIRTYSAFARTGVNGESTAPLIGLHERENRLLGYRREEDSIEVKTGLPWAGESPKRLEYAEPVQSLLKLKKA